MRVRIHFEKRGSLRYTGTLDVQKIWERSIRRSSLKLQYSQGFHPQPKIQIALPLPLGYIGCDEICDIWFHKEYLTDKMLNDIAPNLPDGLSIKSIEVINPHEKSLMNIVESADYCVYLLTDSAKCKNLGKIIDKLMTSSELIRERNKKLYDLRKLILSMVIYCSKDENPQIHMRLSSKPGKTGRPDEVIKELGFDLADCLIERTNIYISA